MPEYGQQEGNGVQVTLTSTMKVAFVAASQTSEGTTPLLETSAGVVDTNKQLLVMLHRGVLRYVEVTEVILS